GGPGRLFPGASREPGFEKPQRGFRQTAQGQSVRFLDERREIWSIAPTGDRSGDETAALPGLFSSLAGGNRRFTGKSWATLEPVSTAGLRRLRRPVDTLAPGARVRPH
ncbi:MAG: hypothetical protein ACE5ID_10980, partial [Acidobacteriota bacterium]